jgi:NCS1 family nucleobase:cation symporter-1
MNAADIRPIAADEQTQSTFDLLVIYVGANIVATTFQVGASLAGSFAIRTSVVLIAIGSVAGAALVAALAPLGVRLRAPSMIIARAPLGIGGASLAAMVLYVTNFAWIAINNVIAASACARILGGPAARTPWALGLGILATWVVARGPRAVAFADRVAVPLMLLVAVAVTFACVNAVAAAPPLVSSGLTWLRGLDIVIGYQVSWILMFADYSRYTPSARGSVRAVFVGLAATSLWMMPLGLFAARAAGSTDPGAMIAALGLGTAGAVLLALATVTTNFVNIYTSSLAWKSVVPSTTDRTAVWSIGLIGTAMSAIPDLWLTEYTNFMILLGAVLVPVGGVLLAHFSLTAAGQRTSDSDVAALYDATGPYRGFSSKGLLAWGIGAAVYLVSGRIGGTLPSLLAAMGVYLILNARTTSARRVDAPRSDGR